MGTDRRSEGAGRGLGPHERVEPVRLVIARGRHVPPDFSNGQLMAVMIDDDPKSSNNQPGQFGIEIEATTKVSAPKHVGQEAELVA